MGYKPVTGSLEPLALHRNVASLSLFYRYYHGKCTKELSELVPVPHSRNRSTRFSDGLHDFAVTVPKCSKVVYANSFFPRTAKLWNSLPSDCFPLSFDLNRFKTNVNRHLRSIGSL